MHDVKLVQIYMPLRGAGDDSHTLVPVYAYALGGDTYRVLGQQPGHENWRWPADSMLTCVTQADRQGPKVIAIGSRVSWEAAQQPRKTA